MGLVSFLGPKGRMYVEIKRVSHEELQLEIVGVGYGWNEKRVIKNEELRKTLLELMKNYKLSPEAIYVRDFTIATYLLL
jgi:hypothetical protein